MELFRSLPKMLGVYPPDQARVRLYPLRWWQKGFGYLVALCAALAGAAAAYLDATQQLPGLG